jgi:hypothetical protein
MEIESFNKVIMLRSGDQADDLGRHVTVRVEQSQAEPSRAEHMLMGH